MKVPIFSRIIMLCMIILPSIHGNAQNTGKSPAEIFRLFTDRNMYVIGEVIRFSAVDPVEMDSADRVLYVELITPDGKQIKGGKFLLGKGKTNGCLEIPEDLLSGFYYIRAYTRVMRNLGPLSYDYVPLTIINPFKSDILASENESSQTLVKDSLLNGPFQFSGIKPQYKTREKAEFRLSEKNTRKVAKGINITIVPEHSVKNYHSRLPEINKMRLDTAAVYFSEKRGISLTGKLMDKDQKESIPGKVVTLSVMGDKDFTGYKTDLNGRFFFTLPYDTGKRDIFLSTVDYNSAGMSLFIDNDFCTRPVNFQSDEFKLTGEEQKLALALSKNYIISREFMKISGRVADTVLHNSKPFYGEPTGILLMDKFIQLPTLREYFDEISLEVKVKERKEGKYFKFLSNDASMMAYDPLILVDWVVINDMEKVLAVSPQKILRIETVNKPYVKGNLTYGGIISIISREGDFAGIDLPASGIFVKYDLFSPACLPMDIIPVAPNIPDARNTLLWIPDYSFDSSVENRILFDTPDTPGHYEILIRGVYPDGHIFGQSVKFEVTK
jgi:hypothetical protein